MSDQFSVRYPSADLTVPDNFAGSINDATSLKTGDIRRKYNFGDRFSELAISQDPFFRFLSMVGKNPTDDPQFKYAEKRGMWHKRYAYVMGFHNGTTWKFDDATLKDTSNAAVAKGGVVKLFMATDYSNKGNIQNIHGQATGSIDVGGTAATDPIFLLPDQIIKVNMSTTASATVEDYSLFKITAVTAGQTATATTWNLETGAANGSGTVNGSYVDAVCIKASSKDELCSFRSDKPLGTVYGSSVADTLEPGRTYVVGSGHLEGSGYPDTWKDQPYSFNHGQTQIWKTAMAMTNTARATSLKYDSNEWARVWKDKLIEHKWDIEQSLLFGSQVSQGDINYTQGAIDFVLNNGNVFNLDTSTKTADDFLDDMSNYIDPRYNNSQATVFFCDTATFNWLHKLGGYFKNNLEVSSQFRSDMAITGKKKVFGVDITTISTPYGDMNVSRNIHLDGSSVKIVGLNMKYASWRPLVGNGVNRDTSVYVGVQTLENSGIDRRVDLILTEAGAQFEMPECHAVWKS
ncbi:MAG: hypothetical protein GOVbin4296_62 [Prokaryotic dsDNA virus sp.]|nr:MAG: hypothetical protein GOVbin4296_62 [Prokaryotic dsDNA virus sp.]|tara:strand:+ start:3410 stop:4963 length:1554 start_codon:yes stop_codon:yes gene_type:complete